MRAISRRLLLTIGAAAAAMCLQAYQPAQAAGELRLLVWEGYADDDWVEEFEQMYDADVSVVYLTSDDEMWTKLKGSDGADFDVFSVNTGGLQKFIDHGLVTPVDLDKIPNRANQLPAFQDPAQVPTVLQPDGKVYGVPLAWGSIGLIYSTEEFPEPPTSWDVMWDPKYAGRVLTFDSSGQNISLGALALGYKDPYHLTPEQMEAAKAKLIELRKNLKTYYQSFEEGVQIWENSDPVLMYSMGELQIAALKRDGYPANYTIPDEGGMGWLDVLSITKGVKDIDLAHKWIDFFISKKISDSMAERHGYGSTVSVTDLDYADKLIWLVPYEDDAWRTDVWNEVKAAPLQ